MIQSNHYDCVATIIAGDNHNLFKSDAQDLQRVTGAARIDWLSQGKAFDLYYPVASVEREALLRSDLLSRVGASSDLIVQPGADRRCRLLGIDMEKTAIDQELLDEMADRLGFGAQVKEITNAAMHDRIDFKESVRQRVALFAGQPVSFLWDVAKCITLMPGARTLVETMKADGAKTCLITGGYTFFTDIVAPLLGVDEACANIFEIHDGVMTGYVAEPILDGPAKLEILCRKQKEWGVKPSCVCMIGDGGNDLPALNGVNASSGLGIGFGSKEVLKDVPHRLRRCSSLVGALYAQGYNQQQFVSSDLT